MRIEQIEFHTVRVAPHVDWTFAQVHADDGRSGLGELNPSVRRSGPPAPGAGDGRLPRRAGPAADP